MSWIKGWLGVALVLGMSACCSGGPPSNPTGACCEKSAGLRAEMPKCCISMIDVKAPVSDCCKALKKPECCRAAERLVARMPDCCRKAETGAPQLCCARR